MLVDVLINLGITNGIAVEKAAFSQGMRCQDYHINFGLAWKDDVAMVRHAKNVLSPGPIALVERKGMRIFFTSIELILTLPRAIIAIPIWVTLQVAGPHLVTLTIFSLEIWFTISGVSMRIEYTRIMTPAICLISLTSYLMSQPIILAFILSGLSKTRDLTRLLIANAPVRPEDVLYMMAGEESQRCLKGAEQSKCFISHRISHVPQDNRVWHMTTSVSSVYPTLDRIELEGQWQTEDRIEGYSVSDFLP